MSLYLQYPFSSDVFCCFVDFFVVGWVKDYLCDAVSVTKVYEYESSVVSSCVHPSCECYFLLEVFLVEFSASVCSFHRWFCIKKGFIKVSPVNVVTA